MNNQSLISWQSTRLAVIPAAVSDTTVIINDFAVSLRDEDKRAIINAYSAQNFGMAAGYIWRKSISRLRFRLAKMGMRFLGEMLNREDISDFSLPESTLTDHNTIYLAEALGFFDSTGAMRMRQGFELINHFDSDGCTEEMSANEASAIVRACVQYVFGTEDSATAINFTQFRERLSSQTIPSDDVSITQLLDSPLFFIRTTLRTLLAAAKIEESARLEHSLANLNTLIPGMWPKLSDEDKWSVGSTFAELTNLGNKPNATAGVRIALLKVQGFDYVPENLRSNSFKRAAQNLLQVHYAPNNFYNEPSPAAHLAAMGSSIPAPAFPECARAYICVILGNRYGRCWDAAQIAEKELLKVPAERWEGYLTRVLPSDRDVLSKLTIDRPVSEWIDLARKLDWGKLNLGNGWVNYLVSMSIHDHPTSAQEIQRSAKVLLEQFKGK